jgi:Tfp pilus assembly ATPase PilU
MADTDIESFATAPTFNFKQAISQMVQRSASDLLLKVGRPPAIRLNGELTSLNMQPLRPEDLKTLAEPIMTPRQIKELAERKEADFAIGVPGVGGSGPTSISSAALRLRAPVDSVTRSRRSRSCTCEVMERSRSSRAAWCW